MTVEFVNKSTVELVQSNATDEMVAAAAWVSNNLVSEERLNDEAKVAGLINFLYRERHMSPFEHGQFTFKITTPIFVAREFHRHRTQSYNEMSGRYTEMPAMFYVPSLERPVKQAGKIGAYTFVEDYDLSVQIIQELQEGSEEQYARYLRLKELGAANEIARMALTINIMTQFYATVNPRNLMQFLDLRDAPQALYEIREVAKDMHEIFRSQMPLTSEAHDRYKYEAVDTCAIQG